MCKNKNKNRLIAAFTLLAFGMNLIEMPAARAADLFWSKGLNKFAAVIEKLVKPPPQNHLGIVAILVEKSLMEENANYGITYPAYSDKLLITTLAERIRRYARDVQNAQEYTKVDIIKIDKIAKTEQIAAMLEKLYQEGDGTKGEINKLAGIVIIGDVPLPVVNKKGNRFISLLPYTDFDDKAYIFDAKSGDFVKNPQLGFTKAEIWHGVIKPPRGGNEGKQLLAQYFDKNHLYHLGVKEFADFENKIFMADLFNEFKSMNLSAFPNYLRYLAHWEDFAYQRFTKKLAQKFLAQTNQQLKAEGLTDEQLHPNQPCDRTCVILKNSRALDFDMDGYPNGYELFAGIKLLGGLNKATNSKNPFSFPLDFSKGLVPFPRLDPPPLSPQFWLDDGSKLDYPDPDPSAAGTTGLSTMPDAQSKRLTMNFVKRYVELFDKFLANTNDWVNFSGRYGAGRDSVGKSSMHNLPSLISIKDEYALRYLKLVNDAVENKIDEFANKLQDNILLLAGAKISGTIVPNADLIAHPLVKTEFVNFASHKGGILDIPYVNGKAVVTAEGFRSPLECTLYRGSDNGSGKNTQIALSMRTFNPLAKEEADDKGCHGSSSARPERCFPYASKVALFDINGTKAVDAGVLPDSATNHRSCFDFKEKKRFDDYKKEVDDYLKKIAEKKGIEDEIVKIPLPGSPYQSADGIVLFDSFGIKLTFADILSKFGLIDGKDNDGDGKIDNDEESDPKYGIPTMDWLQIGERLLKKNKTYSFTATAFTGVNKTDVVVEPQPVKDLKTGAPIFAPSIVFHKEPTAETIEAQKKSGLAAALPVDNPRHVTFQDNGGNFRKIIYPNIFAGKSYSEFLKKLQSTEKGLKDIARINGLNVDDAKAADYVAIDGSLSQLIDAAEDVFDSTAPVKKSLIVKAGALAVADALIWQNANIDEKHQYVLERYLGSNQDPFVEKQKNGYEALYLVSKGPPDALEMRFNGDYTLEETDPKFTEGLSAQSATSATIGTEIDDSSKKKSASDGGGDGIFITEWFAEITKWLKETTTRLSGTFPEEAVCKLSDKTANGDKDKTIYSVFAREKADGKTLSDAAKSAKTSALKSESPLKTALKQKISLVTYQKKGELIFGDKTTVDTTARRDEKTNPDIAKKREKVEIQKNVQDSAKSPAHTQQANKLVFKDLAPGSYGYDDIIKLAEFGILSGYGDGTFKAEQPITREEFTKIDLGTICADCTKFSENVKQKIDQIYQKNPFPDKNFTPELNYCVKEAKNRQIVSGYKGGARRGYFVPEATISRAEATKVLLETAHRQQNFDTPRQNADNSIIFADAPMKNKPWYYNYVLTAQQQHFYPKGRFKQLDRFDPKAFQAWFDGEISKKQSSFTFWLEGKITRAEFAMMAIRLIERNNCAAAAKEQSNIVKQNQTGAEAQTTPKKDDGKPQKSTGAEKEKSIDENRKPPQKYAYSVVGETATKTKSTEEFIDEMPADGHSKLFVKATVFNEKGDIDKSMDGGFIEFNISPAAAQKYAVIEPNIVKIKNGVAETVIKASKKAGEVIVLATLLGKKSADKARGEKSILVTPLEPAKIELLANKQIIKNDGLGATNIHAELKDINDNLINNGSSQLTFSAAGAGELDHAADEDGKKEGVQITSVSGAYDLKLASKGKAGEIIVKVVFEPALDAKPITAQTVVQTRDDPESKPVSATDKTTIKTSTAATKAKLLKKIVLTANKKTMESGSGATVELTARFYDSDNNFAENDSETEIEFRLTDSTKKFGDFVEPALVKVKNGEAKIKLRATNLTGPIRVIASSVGLQPGAVELTSIKTMRAEKFKDLAPRTLFASLLGSAFGNVSKENYLGGWLVFSGTAEVAISLLTEPKPDLKLVDVSTRGKIMLMDENNVKIQVKTAQDANLPNVILIRDTVTNEALAEIFMIAATGSKVAILASDSENKPLLPQNGEVIFVQNIAKSKDYTLQQSAGGVSILKGGNEATRVFNNGSLKLINNDFTASLLDDDNGRLTLKIVDKGADIAKITYSFNFNNDARRLPKNFVFNKKAIYENGMYMRILSSKENLRLEKTFSGNSSVVPQGLALTDANQQLPNSQIPGQNYASLEAAPEEQGVGFHGDNKHMLLFAAGNSIGEANLPYASEIGITLGDPTVRLNNRVNVSKTGFTKDIGKEIYFGDAPIKDLAKFDYNNDGLKDILVAYEDGKIRLLQNNKGYPRFIDRGIFMDITGGIVSMAVADINQDGWEDLIVASKDSCRKGEICINEYENNHGNLIRKYLPLKPFTEKNRVYMVRAADLNNDGYPDLVTSDDTGAIRVFYNRNGEIDPDGQLLGNLGLHIDQTANLKTEVVVAYDGMPKKDLKKSGDNKNYLDLNLSEAKITQPFLYLDLDANLIASEKRAKDLTPPLNVITIGDQIQYTLTFKNNSSKDLKNFMFSDVFPSNMEIKISDFVCSDCEKEKLQFTETGQSSYPYVISGLTIPNGKSRTITYRAAIKSTPKIKLILGKKLSALYSPLPGYTEIGATVEGNTSSRMTYFYPKAKDVITGRMIYDTFISPPPAPPKLPRALTNPLGDILPSKDGFKDLSNEGRAEIAGKINSFLTKETSAEKTGGSLDNIEDDIQKIVDSFGCSQGCLPLPVNFSFLTPGTINAFGVPAGFDPGLPVFGWGVPSIIPVWPPSPYQGSVGGRIYLSPTLTGSLGMGICLGPYLAAQCYSFKIADLLPKSTCAALQKTMESALAKANNAIKSVGNTAMAMSGETADSSGRNATGGMAGSTNLGAYQYKATVSTNFRVPGFPQVITKWLEDQVAEIVNKLTDLPDFYFIYPDPTSLVGSFVPQEGARQNATSGQNKALSFPTFSTKPLKYSENSFRAVLSTPDKLLSFFNSIPLIQVEAREVAVKIPALTATEIEKIRRDAEQWEIDFKEEIRRVKEVWSCDKDSKYQTLCDKLTLDSGKIFTDLEKNLSILEKYKALPRKILAWKNVLGKYLYQIICYMDAITQYFGGYIKKQQNRILVWIDAIRKAKEMLQSWKLILNVMVDYQNSCDKCSSSRFSLLELLTRVFAIIPSPPVIPFPKWPDIYLDLSKVQLGLKIPFPDVRFIPERVIIPKLPRITLPDIPPVTIELPQIPLLPDLPDLNLNLPEIFDLPPLPLPTLPDIPSPPKIPALPSQIQTAMLSLKKLVKILCLLRKGLIPVPELSLKTEIEHLTERGLTPLLPLDIGTKLQIPPIKYNSVDRIEIIGTTNFKLELGHIYEFVQNLANDWNGIATDLVGNANKYLKEAGKVLKTGASSTESTVKKVVPVEEVKLDLDKLSGSATGLRTQKLREKSASAASKIPWAYEQTIAPLFKEYLSASKQLGNLAKIYAQNNKNIGQDIHLVATQRFLAKDDPLLNHNPDEIKARIGREEPSQNETVQKLAATRNALIAYSDGQNQLFDVMIKNKNGWELNKMIAKTPSFDELIKIRGIKEPVKTLAVGNYLASLDQPAATKPAKTIIAARLSDDSLKSLGKNLQKSIESRSKLLAADTGISDVSSTSAPQIQEKGIFIANPDLGINERLINYTDEADQPSQLLFIDMDNDGDEEIVYSYSGNIYLKENYKNSLPGTFYSGEPSMKDIATYLPNATAVDGLRVTSLNNKNVELAWNKANYTDVAGYEITYKLTPEAFERNIGEGSYKIVFFIGAEAPAPDSSKSEEVLRRKLENTENPTTSLTLPNGFYYAKIRSFNRSGSMSTFSNTILLAPSVCADKDPPLPNGGPKERTVTIFKPFTIDASGSFDAGGKILQYHLDTDPAADSDGDGKTTNDKNIDNGNNPIFKLSPYTDLKDRKVILNVTDEALNRSEQAITIHVTVPQVALDLQSASIGAINGNISPSESEMPISIMRNRGGNLTILKTKSANTKGKYLTDGGGKFNVNDLNLKDQIIMNKPLDSNPAKTNLKPGGSDDGISDDEKLRFGRSPAKKITLPYSDVAQNNPYYKDILKLWVRRVFEGIPAWNKTIFEPNKTLTRAEFAHIMLKTFCVIPRRQAYETPSPFTDIKYVRGQLPWYYAIVKEAWLQGFVTGYKREIDLKTGKTQFKPVANITRAEAAKIILEALDKKGIIRMGKIPVTEPYFAPYIKIAQDLTPYLKQKSLVKKPFIITKEEAARPNAFISRSEFVAMADRVLGVYDCSLIDSDGDGMPDYWELQNGLNPYDPSDALLDPDHDGLTNLEEYRHGTDPHNPDTDGGGVSDGDEVKNGLDPLDKKDDADYLKAVKAKQPFIKKPANQNKDAGKSTYPDEKPCTSCPCPAAPEHTADLIDGDIIFAVIANDDNSQIFSKSNELKISLKSGT